MFPQDSSSSLTSPSVTLTNTSWPFVLLASFPSAIGVLIRLRMESFANQYYWNQWTLCGLLEVACQFMRLGNECRLCWCFEVSICHAVSTFLILRNSRWAHFFNRRLSINATCSHIVRRQYNNQYIRISPLKTLVVFCCLLSEKHPFDFYDSLDYSVRGQENLVKQECAAHLIFQTIHIDMFTT